MVATVRIDVDSPVEWWRPLVHWLLCAPHLLYTGVLAAASVAVALPMGVVVLATGRVPQRMAGFQVLTLRERARCYSHFFVLRRSLPPLATAAAFDDPGDDPMVEVSVTPPASAARWSLLLRPFVVLPHLLVLVPIGIVMDLCYPVWMVLAAAHRGWPATFERLLIRVERWVLAVAMYALLVSNEPPRFGLAAYDEAPGGLRTA